jgi:hypothetical protein
MNAIAKNFFKAMECSCIVRDSVYRVNLKGGKEATAYYTICIEDAMATAVFMHLREMHKYRAST